MALTKLPSAGLNNSSVTSGKIPDNSLQDGKFANAAGVLSSKFGITGTQPVISGSGLSFTQKDPAVASNLTITGSSFVQFPEVTFVNQSTGARTTAASVTYTNATTIVAPFPAGLPTALYKVEVENPGGLGALSSQSITNSNAPVYITSSGSLGEFNELDSVSVQIEAYNEDSTAVTYAVQSGSLPAGLSLNTKLEATV